ncbi:hypothetical protein [Streptomyces sp. NPDC008141]|uniref:hypothetical protein n=1 Tax=Streptomyces sp. NPDC008141 TaxID=3364815 RepID=UPI0036EE2F4E
MKLVTRAQWGARQYRTPGGSTPYSRARRGVKVHYLGTGYTDRPHTACAAYVRKLQDSHMDGNGWSDIGYSFVVCTHGYVHEGRGLRRRNSANGNTSLNEQDYAVCALVGSSGLTEPTDDQLDGIRDAIEYCREEGPAGDWIGGHRDGYATSCPGDALYAWVHAGAARPRSTEPTQSEEDTDMPIAKLHETNPTDTELELDEWVGLAFKDAVIHSGPRTLVGPLYVQLTFGQDSAVDAEFTVRFVSTDNQGGSVSGYGDLGPFPARGTHQFLHNVNVPTGKQLRFEIKAASPLSAPVILTHRLVTGDWLNG